jgi:hypothetical protein
MPNSQLSIDEIVSLLGKSSLISVLVEGTTDSIVYRWLEKRFDKQVDFISCGGRNTLLEVYNRKSEFLNSKVFYLADKDLWTYSGIPEQFSEIVFTTGYSIENDIIAGSQIENLLEKSEKDIYESEIDLITYWYAFEIDQYIKTGVCEVGANVSQVIKGKPAYLCENFKTSRGFINPSQEDFIKLRSEYKLKIRGKTIFDVLIRNLNYPSRWAKHQKNAVYETAIKLYPENNFLLSIVDQINQKIS